MKFSKQSGRGFSRVLGMAIVVIILASPVVRLSQDAALWVELWEVPWGGWIAVPSVGPPGGVDGSDGGVYDSTLPPPTGMGNGEYDPDPPPPPPPPEGGG